MQSNLPNLQSESETNPAHQAQQSAYFILNVWQAKLEGGRVEWRGQVLHVDSGMNRAFEDWPDLVDLIADALNDFSSSSAFRDRENSSVLAEIEEECHG